MVKRTAALVLMALFLLVSASLADDEVVLNTGAVLRGQILSVTKDEVKIRIPELGVISMARSRIKSIHRDAEESKPNPSPAAAGSVSGSATSTATTTGATPSPAPDGTASAGGIDVPYGELQPDETYLLILRGQDHGDWTDSGLRLVARIPIAGSKRFQAVFAPDAGVLGFTWIPRKELRRAVRLDGHAGRRLLFFQDIESGSWIEGETADQKPFAGALVGIDDDSKVRLLAPGPRGATETDIALKAITKLSATTRTGNLTRVLDHLCPGEPVAFEVRGRKAEIRGRLLSLEKNFFHLEAPDGPDGKWREFTVFRDLPIIGVKTLPKRLRSAFKEVARGGWITIDTRVVSDSRIVRRSLTGHLLGVNLEEVDLFERGEAMHIPVTRITAIKVPTDEAATARAAIKDASTAKSVLNILPGMSRKEVRRILPAKHDGIVIVWDGDRVGRVFLRPPFEGPVFGIRPGQSLAGATRDTDLVFDTQVTTREKGQPEVTTMVSHTLRHELVRLFLSKGGDVLAIEVSAR